MLPVSGVCKGGHFMETLEPYKLVIAAEALDLLGLSDQANYLIELAYLGFDAAAPLELETSLS